MLWVKENKINSLQTLQQEIFLWGEDGMTKEVRMQRRRMKIPAHNMEFAPGFSFCRLRGGREQTPQNLTSPKSQEFQWWVRWTWLPGEFIYQYLWHRPAFYVLALKSDHFILNPSHWMLPAVSWEECLEQALPWAAGCLCIPVRNSRVPFTTCALCVSSSACMAQLSLVNLIWNMKIKDRFEVFGFFNCPTCEFWYPQAVSEPSSGCVGL